MMPPLSTGNPYQDKINMEDFKVKEKSFNTAVQDFNGTGFMAMPSGNPYLDDGPAGGQGIMGGQDIRQYLTPFLQQIQQRNQAEMQEKIEPYVQEVQQLTDQTFPDLNLSGGGLSGGIGGLFGGSMNPFQGGIGSLFGGGMGGPAVDFMTPNAFFQSGGMQSSPNQNPSPFGTSSFFR